MKLNLLFVALIAAAFMAGCARVDFQAAPVPGNNASGTPGEGAPPPGCTLTSQNTPIITSLPPGVTQQMVQNICPAIGNDSECGVVIFISDNGVALYFTGQGTYDGQDDTLVGVFNMSSTTISSLALSSNLDIMGFDGDGLTSYKINGTNQNVPGNHLDSTGYGGPNVYYTNIANKNTSGTVNFITSVAAGGGSAYFGLEEALSATTACLNTVPH